MQMSPKVEISDGFKSGLIDSVPAIITVFDVRAGKYIYVNLWIKKILGYNPDDFIGQDYHSALSLVHPDDLPVLIKENEKAFKLAENLNPQNSNTLLTLEYRMKHKKGHWVWLRTDGVVCARDPDGKVTQFMNVSVDVTKRHEAESRLQRSTEQLKELNRAKDDFISIASHQLRTPATAVKQYLGLLLGGYSDPLSEDQRVFIEKAYESNERELKIVEDILRTAQLDAQSLRLSFADYDMRDVLDEAIGNISSQFQKKHQKVVFQKPKKPANAAVDKGQILMVFENLLENASHYTPNDKKITITIKKIADNIEVSIADEGVGVKKSDIKRLFQKFSRISNPLTVEAGGSGLGLYWAERVVKMHDGEIRVTSQLHKGTEFTVALPSS